MKFSSPRGLSNSWAVSGAKTASGHAVLANDPHLGLDSPALFHQSHLVVEPATEADGPAVNAYGAQLPGLPGVLIGHNEDIAWGLTTASYDYTDAYVEQLVWRDGETWPRVMHNGEEVELEIVEEEIEIGTLGVVSETITVQIPIVPHRGPLAVEIDGREVKMPEGDQAISLAWRGFEPSDDYAAVLGWMTAQNVEDIREANQSWLIGSQNLLFATREGDIFTTGQSLIPTRPAAAMSWDPETNPDGVAPWWTLSGTGEHDWTGRLSDDLVPQSLNPERGFIVTANNDQTGNTEDNNPLNDYAYTGYDYAAGFRAGRIERLLTGEAGPFDPDHKFTAEQIGEIQHDIHSTVGERVTPFLLGLAARVAEEAATPGTHPALAEVVAANPAAAARLATLQGRLADWSYSAEDGLWGDPTEAQVNDAIATSLFNVWLVALLRRAFGDERRAAPRLSVSSQQQVKALLWLLEHPDDSHTLNADTGESWLWDDIETEPVEGSDAVMFMAFMDADGQLQELFGSDDPATWLWGALHNRNFDSIIPDLSGGFSPLNWPQPDEEFPAGYPRGGDNYNVDRCDGGVTDYRFGCGGGAILRFVAEMNPDGIQAWNAMPGGQVWDPDSPFFRDDLDLWLNNDRHPIPFYPGDVDQAHNTHLLFTP